MGLFSIFKKSSTLYYPGCYAYFKHKEYFELYQKIFSKLGIDFRVINKNICCGLPALEAGYDAEARRLARRNFEIFKEEQITSIITNSPCCYKMFLYDYPKILPDWNIEPKNIWRMILAKLENNPGLIKNNAGESVAFQDSCYLGRYCEVYDEPRKILELIGYEVKELYSNKSRSMCCGSCGGLMTANPLLADEIAKEKILQAKRINAKKIIVSSIREYDLLKKNSEGSGIEVIELGEAIGLGLGIHSIKKEEIDVIENESYKKIQGEIDDKSLSKTSEDYLGDEK